ncbi:MAG: glycosyltransferase [Peptococcaceae bacterium]
MKLSVCMITKDEENNIFRCLKSIKKIADEIVLVDSGSLDNTLEIAQNFKCKIIELLWCDDFSFARNIALDAAQGDWILVIDADEELTKNSADEIRELMNNAQAEGYYVQINNILENGYVLKESAVRLFRNRKNYRFSGKVCEQVLPSIRRTRADSIYNSDQVINHFGYHEEYITEKLSRKIRILRKELAQDPVNPYLLANSGNVSYLLRDYQRAINYYQEALINLTGDESYVPVVYRNLALSYLQEHDYEKSELIIKRGLERFKEYTDLYYLYGNLADATGKYEKACNYYEKSLELGETGKFPSVLGIGSYYSLLSMGKSFEKMGRFEESLTIYGKALGYREIRDQAIEAIVPLATFKKSSVFTGILTYDFTVQDYFRLADTYAFWSNYSACLEILNYFEPHDFVKFFKSYCFIHHSYFSLALEELLNINLINNPRLILNNIFLCACGLDDSLLLVRSVESLKLFLESSAAQVYQDLLNGYFKGAEDISLYLNQCWTLLKEFIEIGLLDWAEKIIDFSLCINKLETLGAAVIFFWKTDNPLVHQYLAQISTSTPTLNLVKGDLMLKMGKYTEALELFESALEYFPDDDLVHYGLNFAKYKQGGEEYFGPDNSWKDKEHFTILAEKYYYAVFKKKNQLAYLLVQKKEGH